VSNFVLSKRFSVREARGGTRSIQFEKGLSVSKRVCIFEHARDEPTNRRNKDVQATVISYHVIAPGRSSRTGNVASTRVDKRQDGPVQARNNTPSRYIELSAIAFTSENPSRKTVSAKKASDTANMRTNCGKVRARAELMRTIQS